ncbi:MAG: MobH family relaxase [Thiothrix sp.]|uniref:MobH family relaxase n=1 Tax=Thiothrix sp. TaxID=1032 RepID=UPI002637F86C|nr:MobH family relaxase [Thiothrix sp.]MDD5395331.1 MobH family relaxase [Thiothrix sp.]
MLARLTGLFRRPAKPACPAIPVLPAGVWPVLPAHDLLQPHHELLARIRALSGTSPDYWAALYQPLLDNFAAFVQQTPASEAHHHCCQGGMLTHSLQVMELAMKARKGKMLPPGAAAEDVNKEGHAWTYAVASAALLHDVGKPCSDQKLKLYNASGQDCMAVWQPLHGALQSGYYQVQFVRDRQYRTHELLPPLLARQLTPAKALSWLQQDFPEVFKVWLAYLSGQDEVAGVLGQMVTAADMESVAHDLMGAKAIHTQQIPTARAKPLSQRLLTGLRFLLDEKRLPLNHPGSAAFFDGQDLWLMSKRVMDELRTHLESEGQTGIPSDNIRLMTELQQHGILTATAAGQAIWKVDIKVGDFASTFTLLRLPANQLWVDPAQYPPIMDGTITPNAKDNAKGTEAATEPKPKAGKAATAQTEAAESAKPPAATVTQPPAPASSKPIPATAHPAAVAALSAATDDDLDEWLPDTIPVPAQAVATVADTNVSPWADDDEPSPAVVTPPAAIALAKPAPITLPQATGDPDSDDTGQRFLHWLSEGLRSNRLPMNTVASLAHTVKEGLLLVSPRVFKEFGGDNWEYAQKRFAKLGLHKRTPDNSNIWLYHVRGEKKSGAVRGFLLENPLEKLGLAYLPVPNKSVSLPDAPSGK